MTPDLAALSEAFAAVAGGSDAATDLAVRILGEGRVALIRPRGVRNRCVLHGASVQAVLNADAYPNRAAAAALLCSG